MKICFIYSFESFHGQCLEVACVSEETAVNKYNKAALIQAKSAAIGITSEEDREIEEIFEDADAGAER